MSPTAPPLTVGFDLDMTLIDTAPGFREVLRALGAELGVALPVEEMTAALGPPPRLGHLGRRRRATTTHTRAGLAVYGRCGQP